MSNAEIAKLLREDLKLAHIPIGMAFLKDPPQGIKHYAEAVPTACTCWKAAERALFYATAEDHYNCPIGAITQGFKLPDEVMRNALALIEQMGKLDYFREAEARNVPTVRKEHRVIAYGPLEDFERLVPDLVLLIVTPFQAMLVSEATGGAAWEGGTPSAILGRPACAVIPSALNRNVAASSYACMGARTFAGIGEQELLQAVPSAVLPRLAEQLPKILAANAAMKEYYAAKKAQFAQV